MSQIAIYCGDNDYISRGSRAFSVLGKSSPREQRDNRHYHRCNWRIAPSPHAPAGVPELSEDKLSSTKRHCHQCCSAHLSLASMSASRSILRQWPRLLCRPSSNISRRCNAQTHLQFARVRWTAPRGYATISAAECKFGQPVHETHPHILEPGECE